jgi:hypothetical protein
MLCGPGSVCTNTDGNYTCACAAGYSGPWSANTNCSDIDECATLEGLCNSTHTCENTPGSYLCSWELSLQGSLTYNTSENFNLTADMESNIANSFIEDLAVILGVDKEVISDGAVTVEVVDGKLVLTYDLNVETSLDPEDAKDALSNDESLSALSAQLGVGFTFGGASSEATVSRVESEDDEGSPVVTIVIVVLAIAVLGAVVFFLWRKKPVKELNFEDSAN